MTLLRASTADWCFSWQTWNLHPAWCYSCNNSVKNLKLLFIDVFTGQCWWMIGFRSSVRNRVIGGAGGGVDWYQNCIMHRRSRVTCESMQYTSILLELKLSSSWRFLVLNFTIIDCFPRGFQECSTWGERIACFCTIEYQDLGIFRFKFYFSIFPRFQVLLEVCNYLEMRDWLAVLQEFEKKNWDVFVLILTLNFAWSNTSKESIAFLGYLETQTCGNIFSGR